MIFWMMLNVLINDVEIGQQASRDAFSKRHLLPTEHWVALGGFRVLLLFCKCIFDLFWRNASLAGTVIAAKYLSCIKISSKEFTVLWMALLQILIIFWCQKFLVDNTRISISTTFYAMLVEKKLSQASRSNFRNIISVKIIPQTGMNRGNEEMAQVQRPR